MKKKNFRYTTFSQIHWLYICAAFSALMFIIMCIGVNRERDLHSPALSVRAQTSDKSIDSDKSIKQSKKHNHLNLRAPLNSSLIEAEHALRSASSIKNLRERARVTRKIIEGLCKAGLVEEAWNMVETGPGIVRNAGRNAWFENAGLTLTQVETKLDQLPYKNELGGALIAYAHSLNLEDMKTLLENPLFDRITDKIKPSEPAVVSNLLHSYLADRIDANKSNEEHKEIAKFAASCHSKGLIDDSGFADILRLDTSKTVEEKLYVVTEKIKSTDGTAGEVRKEIVLQIMQNDPVNGITQIVNIPETLGAKTFNLALQTWAYADGNAANSWFDQNKTYLSPANKDEAAHVFSQMALNFGEIDGAYEWANQVVNPSLRQKLFEDLASLKSSGK